MWCGVVHVALVRVVWRRVVWWRVVCPPPVRVEQHEDSLHLHRQLPHAPARVESMKMNTGLFGWLNSVSMLPRSSVLVDPSRRR